MNIGLLLKEYFIKNCNHTTKSMTSHNWSFPVQQSCWNKKLLQNTQITLKCNESSTFTRFSYEPLIKRTDNSNCLRSSWMGCEWILIYVINIFTWKLKWKQSVLLRNKNFKTFLILNLNRVHSLSFEKYRKRSNCLSYWRS